MTYLLLWKATDKPTLFESDEFETYKDAAKAMVECHAKYPWNTYIVAQIETVAVGTGKNTTLPVVTITSSSREGEKP